MFHKLSKATSSPKTVIYLFLALISWIIILASSFGPQDTRAVAPFSASRVYGQTAGFTTRLPNNGFISATGLNQPTGIARDSTGGLYVVDNQNNRVLFFASGSTTATRVYGQPNFTSNNGGLSASSLLLPMGVTLDGTGNLYIADSFNNRVLYYPAGSTTATKVYGQPNFVSRNPNNGGLSPTTLNGPIGLAVDTANGLYIADANNNRVLYYSAGGTTATRVYGQPNFTSNTPNNGGRSANTLASPYGLAVDNLNNLYVADNANSRALFYPAGSTTATRVYGKPDFTSGPNFDLPSETNLVGPTGLAVDSSGLYIADYPIYTFSANRVLHYSPGNTTADRLYGEPDFFSVYGPNDGGRSATSLYAPSGVASDGQGGLLVADRYNNRVLFYASGSVSASQVYGRPDFTSGSPDNGQVNASGLSVPRLLTVDSTGGLYAADQGNNRVLYYPPGATVASRVYGQPDFTTNNFSYSVSADTFLSPEGLAIGPGGGLYIADSEFSRVLYYPAGSTTATIVYGQPDFTSHYPNNGGLSPSATSLYGPQGLAITGGVNPGLYVADRFNSRVLFYPTGSTTASRVYGQPDFTSASPNNGGLSAASLSSPEDIAVDSAGGLYVNDKGNNRVLYYPTGSTVATRVYGQPGFTSITNPAFSVTPSADNFSFASGLTVDQAGGLYVGDVNFSRVLYFPPGSTRPNYVFGQPDYTSRTNNNGGLGAASLASPAGVALDSSGNLYISDTGNSRVLYYNQAIMVQNQADDGSATTVGSFSKAVSQANSGTYRVITFAVGVSNITLTGGRIPEVAAGITILGRCGGSGPQITINGSGAGPGNPALVLNGSDSIFGLYFKGFPDEQLVAKSTSGRNEASCLKVNG